MKVKIKLNKENSSASKKVSKEVSKLCPYLLFGSTCSMHVISGHVLYLTFLKCNRHFLLIILFIIYKNKRNFKKVKFISMDQIHSQPNKIKTSVGNLALYSSEK